MFGRLIKAAAVIMLAAAAISGGAAWADGKLLNGAGGTAIYPVIAKWADQYQKNTGIAANYQAIGSGGGIKAIESRTVDFANSDKPLEPAELKKQGLVQFPEVIIGITPVVNVPGIKPGELVLDGATLADIYLGKITRWNDAAIAKLNPGVSLPDSAITVVHRSDGSGTTFNFTDYLAKVSPEWKARIGSDTSVAWPAGVGGKGNAGVASFVNQIRGSIGYVEYAYAMQAGMAYTRMINKDGKTVPPTLKTFQAASVNADFGKVEDFYLILTDQPGARSWPITAATYMLMRKDYPKAQNRQVLEFLQWALVHGQPQAEALDYVPLPKSTVKQIEKYWETSLGIRL
jgi:phosphate transport system substrate-binding protein